MLKVALYVFCCCSFAEVQGDETTFYHLPYLQAPLRSSCKVILPYLIKFFAFHVFCLLSPKILRICSPSFTALFCERLLLSLPLDVTEDLFLAMMNNSVQKDWMCLVQNAKINLSNTTRLVRHFTMLWEPTIKNVCGCSFVTGIWLVNAMAT